MKSERTTSQTRKISILALMTALMTLVYIFGASPYASDGTFGTLQAQGNNGAITGLTLTSDTPGTLSIAWVAPEDFAPTDYRLDWAKTDEDYTSWKVDGGHKYPTVTSVELTDLDQGVEYKVRARARFHKGEYKGAPWSGPWVEESLLVSSTPPPVATPKPPVVVPKSVPKDDPPPPLPVPSAPVMWYTIIDGKVVVGRDGTGFLDASITGYQILRGPGRRQSGSNRRRRQTG